jgi:ribonuclease PH
LVLDLEYEEDHLAAVDCNLVAARGISGGDLDLVELQGTGEGRPFSRVEATALIDLGLRGCAALMEAQRAALA